MFLRTIKKHEEALLTMNEYEKALLSEECLFIFIHGP
jgi:hypothetical protein